MIKSDGENGRVRIDAAVFRRQKSGDVLHNQVGVALTGVTARFSAAFNGRQSK
jgi:hypothetical protein